MKLYLIHAIVSCLPISSQQTWPRVPPAGLNNNTTSTGLGQLLDWGGYPCNEHAIVLLPN